MSMKTLYSEATDLAGLVNLVISQCFK